MQRSRGVILSILVFLSPSITQCSSKRDRVAYIEGNISVEAEDDTININYDDSNVKLRGEFIRFRNADGKFGPHDDFAFKMEDQEGYRLDTLNGDLITKWPQPKHRGFSREISSARQNLARSFQNLSAPENFEAEWKYLKNRIFAGTILNEGDNFDEKQNFTTTSVASGPQTDQELSLRASRSQRQLMGSGSGGRFKRPETDRIEDPSFFFRQEIELWSQSVGRVEGTHHSGTRTLTYQKRKCVPENID